jgi:hypothetical protein
MKLYLLLEEATNFDGRLEGQLGIRYTCKGGECLNATASRCPKFGLKKQQPVLQWEGGNN